MDYCLVLSLQFCLVKAAFERTGGIFTKYILSKISWSIFQQNIILKVFCNEAYFLQAFVQSNCSLKARVFPKLIFFFSYIFIQLTQSKYLEKSTWKKSTCIKGKNLKAPKIQPLILHTSLLFTSLHINHSWLSWPDFILFIFFLFFIFFIFFVFFILNSILNC